METCPTLRASAETFETSISRVRSLLADLDSATANRQPRPGSWSTLQALEHLNVAARIYQPRMEAAIAEADPGNAPYANETLTGKILLSQLRPDAGKRLKAPKVFRPATSSLTVVRVLDDFERAHDTWMRLIDAAEGRDLGSARVRLPIPLPLHLTLAQAFELHELHVPRHVAQAERAATAVRVAAA